MEDWHKSLFQELVILSPVYFIRQVIWEFYHHRKHKDLEAKIVSLQEQIGQLSIGVSEVLEAYVSEKDRKTLRLILEDKQPKQGGE